MSEAYLSEDTWPDLSPPNYLLLEKLGAGGMGEVFLARRKDGDALVAIKFLLAIEKIDKKELRQRFYREARLLASLSHPNVVRVLESGVVEGQPYFVMEYVEGGNLRDMMTPGRPFPLENIKRVLTGLFSALVTLEQRQIVHRDLKPENVLLDGEGQVKITDFGISATETEVGQLTRDTRIFGSVEYMSPEQRARLPTDTRADQFSAGVLVYELLTGKRPVGNFKPASELNRAVHSSVDEALARALEEDPDDRYPNFSAFAEAIQEALNRKPRSLLRVLPVFACGVLVLVTGIWALVAFVGAMPPKESKVLPAQSPKPQDTAAVRQVPAVRSTPEKRHAKGKGPAEQPEDRTAEANYYLAQGDKHLVKSQYRDAELCFAEVIRLSPDDPRGYLKRAFVYKTYRLYQKAFDDLKAALKQDPTRVEAWTGVGAIYVQLKDYNKAIPHLDEAIALDSRASEALAWRGWARYQLKQPEAALDDLDAAIRADKFCGVGYQFRGLLYRAQKEYDLSLKDFEHAVRCMPDNPYMHGALANMLALCPNENLRDPDRALLHAQKACKLTAWSEWKLLRYLAQAHAAKGNLSEAVRWCEKALEITPVLKRNLVQKQLALYRKRAGTRAP
ncbi:MAG: protein kinase [Gemmataceae bacterium]